MLLIGAIIASKNLQVVESIFPNLEHYDHEMVNFKIHQG